MWNEFAEITKIKWYVYFSTSKTKNPLEYQEWFWSTKYSIQKYKISLYSDKIGQSR